jgi:hypothetical protein
MEVRLITNSAVVQQFYLWEQQMGAGAWTDVYTLDEHIWIHRRYRSVPTFENLRVAADQVVRSLIASDVPYSAVPAGDVRRAMVEACRLLTRIAMFCRRRGYLIGLQAD